MTFRLLLYGCFASILLSCSSTYYYADFLVPSEVYVPSNVKRLGLLNRGAGQRDASPIYIDGVPVEYFGGVGKAVGDQTLNVLATANLNLNRYQTVLVPLDGYVTDDRKVVQDQLSQHVVDSICEANYLDGLVSIDGIDISIRTSGEINVVPTTDQFGNVVRVPEFSQDQEITYQVSWRFYQAGDVDLIDSFSDEYRRITTTVSYARENDSRERLPEDFEVVAKMAAYDYMRRISPHWKEDYRLYYQGGESLSRISSNLDYNANWEEAASQWIALTNSEDLNTRYMAMYNMAVASEMIGNPRLAKDWAVKAKAVKHTKQVDKYLEIIDRQILIYDVLEYQLTY